MSAFWKHAEEIFEAARHGGAEECELSILLHRDGSIHMLTGSEWQLESLRQHHGAAAAYHVSRKAGGLRLEARSAGESCVFQTSQRAHPQPVLAPDFPRYLMIR